MSNKPMTAEERRKQAANHYVNRKLGYLPTATPPKTVAAKHYGLGFMEGAAWESLFLGEETRKEIAAKDQRIKELESQLSEVTRQRDDEAISHEHTKLRLNSAEQLIERYKEHDAIGNIIWDQSDPELHNDTEVFLSRLSSGETKPVSPWISVEDRLPEFHKWYLVSTPYCSYPSMAGQFNGEKWISTDTKESEIYDVKFYMEHPAPPESLTDKK